MSMPGTPATMSPSTFQSQLEVNLTSVYNLTHHLLPHMESRRSGVILNIASIAALRYIGKPQIAYSATKAAVIQFTKVTAAMYADKGIRCNVVVPGLMHTPLVEVLAEKYNKGDYEGLVARRNQGVPLGGMGTGWDTANALVWLASGCARYVTGQELVVDGGITGWTAPG
jgi:NAD(P)-dependent dehydrogenase (short-subunit alcohol dehydrogenase family)